MLNFDWLAGFYGIHVIWNERRSFSGHVRSNEGTKLFDLVRIPNKKQKETQLVHEYTEAIWIMEMHGCGYESENLRLPTRRSG